MHTLTYKTTVELTFKSKKPYKTFSFSSVQSTATYNTDRTKWPHPSALYPVEFEKIKWFNWSSL